MPAAELQRLRNAIAEFAAAYQGDKSMMPILTELEDVAGELNELDGDRPEEPSPGERASREVADEAAARSATREDEPPADTVADEDRGDEPPDPPESFRDAEVRADERMKRRREARIA
jgi:hypothetical protein